MEKAKARDDDGARRPARIQPRSRAVDLIARTGGVPDSRALFELCDALLVDVILGAMGPRQVNAACNVLSKKLRGYEIQQRIGTTTIDHPRPRAIEFLADADDEVEIGGDDESEGES